MIQRTMANILKVRISEVNIYFYSFLTLNILGEYCSSKKLLDSNFESSARVTRVT